MKLKLLVIFTLLSSCAQVTSLNLKKHEFGKLPTKIIWLQVAGLQPEHIAMLKFDYPDRDTKTAFENSLCIGSAWEYNLFDIRPSAKSGFLSQITGKKNIQNFEYFLFFQSCDSIKKWASGSDWSSTCPTSRHWYRCAENINLRHFRDL